jgi:hypothetical protein
VLIAPPSGDADAVLGSIACQSSAAHFHQSGRLAAGKRFCITLWRTAAGRDGVFSAAAD